MNTGRFVGASVAVRVVRLLLNGTFYSKVFGSRLAPVVAAHPGIFKQNIAGHVVADLTFAIVCIPFRKGWQNALGGGVIPSFNLILVLATLKKLNI